MSAIAETVIRINVFARATIGQGHDGGFQAMTQAEMGKIKKLSVHEWATWLERQRQGFYGGCRVDAYSPQVGEFVQACMYYLKKEFGIVVVEGRKPSYRDILRNREGRKI